MLVIKKTKPDFILKRAFILFPMEPAAATQRDICQQIGTVVSILRRPCSFLDFP
jgi:hypothetical protein